MFKMTLTYQPGFLHYFFIFKQLYKTTLFIAVIQTYMKTNSKHQGRKKQGHNVQGDYKHFGNQIHFPIRSILFRSILYKG